jgi:NAD(P)-dependent dehydrogenase (short-subunit alcohol dehydrogenase family)
MIDDLRDKVVLITGAAGGIGLGMARAFAEAGSKVAIADIDEDALEEAASELASTGAKVLAVRLDVTDRPGWKAAAEKVQAALGTVRVLCNNAGVSSLGVKFEDVTPQFWDKIIDINLTGVFNGINCFFESMRAAGGGHIVNTASMGGLMGGVPTLAPYAATKFGVVGFSEGLRAELEGESIGVSVVCPGGVRSRLWRTSQRARGVPDSDVPPSGMSGQSASPKGMDPYQVGLRVVDAVRNDELYVLTHAEFRAPVVARHQQLMAAFDKAEGAVQSADRHRDGNIPL